jgi:hypothetical protein
MVDSIIGKHCRVGEAQLIAIKELVCHIAEGAGSLMARVGEVVEALFQFASTLLFRIFCNGLGRAFARLLNTPSRKPELIPSNITTTKETYENGSCSPAYSLSAGEDSKDVARRIVRTSRNIFCGPAVAAPSRGMKP